MFAATLQAAATLLLSAGLATYVALSPARANLRNRLLAVLGALVIWSAGVIWRFTAANDHAAFLGFVFGWLGVVALPPLWLLLSAQYARIAALEERPWLAVPVFVPGVLGWLALATNDAHHLFLRSFSQETLTRGPLFFAWLLFAYPCIVVGVGLFVMAARRTFGRQAWLRSGIAALAAVLPTATSVAFVFQWLPLRFDPTPMALGVSVVALTLGIFRLQFLDAVPLARRDVVDHLRDGVLIADAEGVVLDANPAALDVIGRPLAELRGRRLSALLDALGVAPAGGELGQAIDALEPDRSFAPTEVETAAGRWIHVTAKCLRGPQGDVLGRFAVLRDRTEERKYERLIRQSQKLETVGSLAAGVAHEVNNPLAYVRANLGHVARVVERLAKRTPEPAPADAEEWLELPQIVAECLDGIERIGRIVDAMRRFSRVPSDELQPVDVNQVVREAVRLAELHRARNVVVEAWLAEVLPPVQGSAQRLTQVFLNLLVNAKQALAGRAGGTITVRTHLARDIVRISVSDDGPGIPEAIRDHVFDPFFTTKGPEEGTGLGLSIAFDIIREHGGVLELKCGPQGGACFLAHLPAHADADPLAASAAAGG